YYPGPAAAKGTITKTGAIVNGVDKFQVGGVYYVWGTSFNPSDAGTNANPFVVAPLADPMGQLQKAVNATGTPGVDYSSTISAPNVFVSASSTTTITTFTALTVGTGGNAITLGVTGGTGLSASGSTLTGGGVHALLGCTVPDGQIPLTIGQVS